MHFTIEWEEAGAVQAPELRATWCRLEIWVGEECITRVEDAMAMATRRSIYVPLDPLAEWAAYHWWILQFDHRPQRQDSYRWTYERFLRDPGHRNAWLRQHNLRSAGDGYCWPDLTLVPDGDTLRLVWFNGRSGCSSEITFLASGSATATLDQVTERLADLIQTTIGRLDEKGIHGTALHQEWDAITRLDADERVYCQAMARLGIDPFSTTPDLDDALITASQILPPSVLDDFLDAVEPRQLLTASGWVIAAQQKAATVPNEALESAADLIPAARGVPRRQEAYRPWEVGYEQARAVRHELGLASTSRFDIERYVGLADYLAPDRVI